MKKPSHGLDEKEITKQKKKKEVSHWFVQWETSSNKNDVLQTFAMEDVCKIKF